MSCAKRLGCIEPKALHVSLFDLHAWGVSIASAPCSHIFRFGPKSIWMIIFPFTSEIGKMIAIGVKVVVYWKKMVVLDFKHQKQSISTLKDWLATFNQKTAAHRRRCNEVCLKGQNQCNDSVRWRQKTPPWQQDGTPLSEQLLCTYVTSSHLDACTVMMHVNSHKFSTHNTDRRVCKVLQSDIMTYTFSGRLVFLSLQNCPQTIRRI